MIFENRENRLLRQSNGKPINRVAKTNIQMMSVGFSSQRGGADKLSVSHRFPQLGQKTESPRRVAPQSAQIRSAIRGLSMTGCTSH